MNTPVRIGLLRLADSAPVLLATDRGLFRDQGLDVRISIEPSWANIADKLSYGLLDAAVMLPPLALACALGLRGVRVPLWVPMGLTQGGNTIVISPAATRAIAPLATDLLATDPIEIGRQLVHWSRAQSEPPRFAVVHAFSTHNLLLRSWLAGCGADPDKDIRIVSIPPELVVPAMAEGAITGFCAGAPWGSVAEQSGNGRILLGTSRIWPAHPEKCLAVRAAWAAANAAAVRAVLQALLRAGQICDDHAEADAIATLLGPDGLGLSRAACLAALPGGAGPERVAFHTPAVWYPDRAHAAWFFSQMCRWGWAERTDQQKAAALATYRPDLLMPVAEAAGLAWPHPDPI